MDIFVGNTRRSNWATRFLAEYPNYPNGWWPEKKKRYEKHLLSHFPPYPLESHHRQAHYPTHSKSQAATTKTDCPTPPPKHTLPAHMIKPTGGSIGLMLDLHLRVASHRLVSFAVWLRHLPWLPNHCHRWFQSPFASLQTLVNQLQALSVTTCHCILLFLHSCHIAIGCSWKSRSDVVMCCADWGLIVNELRCWV